MNDLQSLIAIAEQHDTANLKKIQRHQRTKLMLAKRNRDRQTIAFLQVRVDAAAQILAARKVA